jgi:hypothetical protein
VDPDARRSALAADDFCVRKEIYNPMSVGA